MIDVASKKSLSYSGIDKTNLMKLGKLKEEEQKKFYSVFHLELMDMTQTSTQELNLKQ